MISSINNTVIKIIQTKMAKLIEISGPNGVGKSTILNKLNEQWKENSLYITSDRFFPKKKIIYTNLKSFLYSTYQYFRRTEIDLEPLSASGSRFVKSHQDFIDKFVLLLATDKKFGFNGVDLRPENIPFFYKATWKVHYIREAEIDTIVLLDEGFIHHLGRLVNKGDQIELEKQQIFDLLKITPLPDAIIYLELDAEENAKRLVERNKTLNMHENLSYNEILDFVKLSQKRREVINEYLISQKVPILYIDSKDPFDINCRKINSFIEKINLTI